MPHVTATILFHAEGPLAVPALASLRDMVQAARAAGLAVEARALLDRADDATRSLVAAHGAWLDAVSELSLGDPGLARNAGAEQARGEYVAFLDGDDLWGPDWLRLAYAAATAPGAPGGAIWHPETLYCFDEVDFDRRPIGGRPNPDAGSLHWRQPSSDAPDFDRDILLLTNLWSANAFATRALHRRFPYRARDRARGFGFEDWSWNIETLWAGVPHLVVPGTVHLLRVKDAGSENRRNLEAGLLPYLPEGVRPALGPRRRPA